MTFLRRKLLEVRAARQDRSAYQALIATPASAAFRLPAGGRFKFQARSNRTAGATVCTVVGATTRTLKCDAMSTGELYTVDWLEAGCVVTAGAGFDMLLHMGLGVYVKIAQGA